MTPCHRCLMKPICKNKRYHKLMKTCSPLLKTLYKIDDQVSVSNRVDDFEKKLEKVIEDLNPTRWKLGRHGYIMDISEK